MTATFRCCRHETEARAARSMMSACTAPNPRTEGERVPAQPAHRTASLTRSGRGPLSTVERSVAPRVGGSERAGADLRLGHPHGRRARAVVPSRSRKAAQPRCLDGAPPYARLTLPAAPTPLLIVNLGPPFRIRGGTDVETVEYADGCVITTPTRAWEFGYPPRTRSVGVHFKPWGLGPFLPMPAAELCDRPATVEQVWGRPPVAELRDRLATAAGRHEMLTLLEDELMRRLRESRGLALVRHASTVIAETSGAVAVGDLSRGSRGERDASGTAVQGARRGHPEAVGPQLPLRRHRARARPGRTDRLAHVAAGAGYFDQAHFGHEFRGFSGFTPTRYVDVRRQFLREHPGHVLDGWPLPAD